MRDHPADLVLDRLEVREGWPNCRRSLTWSIARSSSPFAPPTEPVPSPIRPLLSTCIATRNPAGLAEDVLRRHPDVVEAEVAEVVGAEAHLS